MATTKTSSTSPTNNTTYPGFRIVMRGKSKGGKTKRAVRTVRLPNVAAVDGYMAENGEALAKSAGFDVQYVTVFPPIGE